MSAANKSVYVTVGFKCDNKDAFDEFWRDIRQRYRFAEDSSDCAAQAFAVSMGNMFEEQDVIDAILSSDLDRYDMVDALGLVPCNQDLKVLCAEYGIRHPYEDKAA